MRQPSLPRRSALLAILSSILAPAARSLAEDAPAPASGRPAKSIVYVGTYSGAKSQGIYSFTFDLATGKAGAPEVAAKTESPSFLALHPSRRFLYAVNELHAPEAGGVSAFAIEASTGKLTFLNREASRGSDPCHLALDPRGRHLVVANYGGPGVAVLPVGEDGRLGPACAVVPHHGSSADPARQKGPHPHCVVFDAKGEWLVAADLGIDRLLVYPVRPEGCVLDPKAAPRSTPVKSAAGPRHFVFHPGGRAGYCVNELDCTLTAFAWDPARGALDEVGTLSTLPVPWKEGYSGAEVQVHPSGKFLYASNRGHHSIAVFGLDAKGVPRLVETTHSGGKTPRHFGLDPTGSWLLASNQDSDTIVVFRVDPATGRLTPTGEEVRVPVPVCAVFLEKA